MYMFDGCKNLETLKLPLMSFDNSSPGTYSLCGIGTLTENGTDLSDLQFSDSTEVIGAKFLADAKIKGGSFTIPQNIKSIKEYALNSEYITNIRIKAIVPPTLGANVFHTNIVTIKVPAESVDSYKSATGWAGYADKIVADDTVE